MDKRLADNLRRFALQLHAHLAKGDLSLTAAGRFLGEDFRKAKPSTLQMQDFVKLYPSLFKTVGEAQAMKISSIKRRIRSKRPV